MTDFEKIRHFIGNLSGKFIEFISQEVREALILSDQIITRSRKFFLRIFLSPKFAQHMK